MSVKGEEQEIEPIDLTFLCDEMDFGLGAG